MANTNKCHRGTAVPGFNIILSTICEELCGCCSSSSLSHPESSRIQLEGELPALISGVKRCVDSSACLMLSILQEGIHPTDRCQCSGDRSSVGAGRPCDSLCQSHLKDSTVLLNGNAWQLSLQSNTLGIIYWDNHSAYTLTISHYNGFLLRR